MLSIVRPAGSELCHFSALGRMLARRPVQRRLLLAHHLERAG
jgi:hypothetical protein